MPPSGVHILLAAEEDAKALASLTTTAFSACDKAFPLIWGSAEEGLHDEIALKGLFTPTVQREGRVTIKAVSAIGTILGFATWVLPKSVTAGLGKKESGGLPDLPLVNMALWNEKNEGPKKFFVRDVDETKDYHLALFFVHLEHQRKGIGSSLLEWGKNKADETGAKIWLTSTPQAMPVYEKNGWKVCDTYEIDLVKHGGQGNYVRYWMLRVGSSAQ